MSQPCDGENCLYEEKIEKAYKLLVIGNGELPIPERLRNLEHDMNEVLPLLREMKEDMKSAADNQAGRDQQRQVDEKKRDKAWATFRRAVITISTILGIVLILLQINKQIKLGVITIPKVRMEWKSLPVLARGSSTISTSVPNDDDTADNNVNP